MPKKLEKELKAQAKKKGLNKKQTGAYIYGTMRKTGWKPGEKSSTAGNIRREDYE